MNVLVLLMDVTISVRTMLAVLLAHVGLGTLWMLTESNAMVGQSFTFHIGGFKGASGTRLPCPISLISMLCSGRISQIIGWHFMFGVGAPPPGDPGSNMEFTEIFSIL